MLAKLFTVALPVFLVLDMIWLWYVAKGFYRAQIWSLLKTDVNWIAAFAFYAIFIAGLVFFAIAPAVERQSWLSAMLVGGFFGFVCYATYDLTNLSVAKDWPLAITLVDMAWGAVLSATVSVAAYHASAFLGIWTSS